jgi:sulfur carrier protein
MLTEVAEALHPGWLEVNGRRHALVVGSTVAEVVARHCDRAEGLAVARNREVVPKSEWQATMVEAGDRIEIVSAAAGG